MQLVKYCVPKQSCLNIQKTALDLSDGCILYFIGVSSVLSQRRQVECKTEEEGERKETKEKILGFVRLISSDSSFNVSNLLIYSINNLYLHYNFIILQMKF